MKVSIFNGSVRKDGRTAAVTSVLKDAMTANGARVNEYFLYSMGIKGCLTCGCGPGKDCATDLVDKLLDDDIAIFASPIRMQRTTDSLNGFMEMLFHMCRFDEDTMKKANGKRTAVVLVTSEGTDSADESLRLFAEFFERTGMNFVYSILVQFDGNEPIMERHNKENIRRLAERITEG